MSRSTGMLNLVCSDLTRDVEQMTTIYQKRWNTIVAVFKLECIENAASSEQFALRAKLLIKATQQAFEQLQALRFA
jgi:hypothetical protein